MRSSQRRTVTTCVLAISMAALTGIFRNFEGAFAYEPETHRALSELALDHPQCVVRDRLRRALRLDLFADPLTFEARLSLTDPARADTILFPLFDRNSLRAWVAEGSEHEDYISALALTVRPRNHFYEPTDNAGLRICIPDDVGSLSEFADSLLWAWDAPANIYNWRAARDLYFRALTNPDEYERRSLMAGVFYRLGHIVHLIQDIGQPQHTRNDSHLPNEGSNYEQYCADLFNNSNSYVQFPPTWRQYPLPVFEQLPQDHPNGHAILPDFEALWDTNQLQPSSPSFGSPFLTTPGLAEYTNWYFLTHDTMFGECAVVVRDPSDQPVQIKFSHAGRCSTQKFFFPSPRFSTLLQGLTSIAGGVLPSNQATVYCVGQSDPTSGPEVLNLFGPGAPVSLGTLSTHFSGPNYLAANFSLADQQWQNHAENLLPKCISYSTAALNLFFSGAIAVGSWSFHSCDSADSANDATIPYDFTILNCSSDQLGPGGHWTLVDPEGWFPGLEELINSTYGSQAIVPGESMRVRQLDNFLRDVYISSGDRYITVVFRGPIGRDGDAIAAYRAYFHTPGPG